MSDWKEIVAQQVKEKIETGEAKIVDIRDPGSYEMTHIPGAIQLDDLTVKDFLETTDKAMPIIVYCYHGISSRGAAAFFAEQGFQEVYSMAGGFESWRFNYPTEP